VVGITGPPQHTVAPSRQTTLFQRIMLVCLRVILVHQEKDDGSLGKSIKLKAAIMFNLMQELIMI
jgi:hypothetical protein